MIINIIIKMNNKIVKNILFYGSFGGFGIYTFYEVAKSELNRKMKSNHYYENMIQHYIILENCNNYSEIAFKNSYHIKNPNILIKNLNNNSYFFIDEKLMKEVHQNKEYVIKSINPENIKYHSNCTDYYNDFRKSYNDYKLYKYEHIPYKYGI